MNAKNMSFFARLVHTVGFEVFGVILFTPFAVVVLNDSILHMGALTIIVSLMAMLWNLLYNYIFDLIENQFGHHRSRRKLFIRVMHAVLFEAGLLIVTVPLVAYWLNMGFLEALIVDIGFVIFYLVYAFFYNYIFDRIYFGMATAQRC